MVQGERGISKLGFLFVGSIIGGIVWLGFRVMPIYYDYYEILGLMEEQAAKSQVLNDLEILDNLTKRIRKLGIPIGSEERIKIFRTGSRTKIEFQYKEILDVDFGKGRYYKLWVFDFHPVADREAGR